VIDRKRVSNVRRNEKAASDYAARGRVNGRKTEEPTPTLRKGIYTPVSKLSLREIVGVVGFHDNLALVIHASQSSAERCRLVDEADTGG